jgi:hypothetical protein
MLCCERQIQAFKDALRGCQANDSDNNPNLRESVEALSLELINKSITMA